MNVRTIAWSIILHVLQMQKSNWPVGGVCTLENHSWHTEQTEKKISNMLMTLTIISIVIFWTTLWTLVFQCVSYLQWLRTLPVQCDTIVLESMPPVRLQEGWISALAFEEKWNESILSLVTDFFLGKKSTFELTILSYKRLGDTYLIPDVYIAHEAFV